MHQDFTLHGLTVFYPEQKQAYPPVPYPWAVRGIGDNCSLVDVLLQVANRAGEQAQIGMNGVSNT